MDPKLERSLAAARATVAARQVRLAAGVPLERVLEDEAAAATKNSSAPATATIHEFARRVRSWRILREEIVEVPAFADGWARVRREIDVHERPSTPIAQRPAAVLGAVRDKHERPAPPADILDEQSRPKRNEVTSGSVIETHVDTKAPLTNAKLYSAERSGGGDKRPNLVFWQEAFYGSKLTHYELVPNDAMRADLYRWYASKRGGDLQTIKPTPRLIDNILDALKAVTYLDVKDAPAWLDGRSDPAASELIAFPNGLLHVPTRSLHAPTRDFFGLNVLDFPYDPAAPSPVAWLRFLRQLWADDIESIESLQEIFGLLLTNETRYQKAFLLVGPRRSGKGTVARILSALVGMANVTAPMLSSLGQQFGLESMIGKLLALVSDARLGTKDNHSAIGENLLRITGEDAISVPRKFRHDWTARLRVRFVILSNELPALLDHSGALASRFILLRLTRSFFREEDLSLSDKLLRELPGILLWSLDGLERLHARGHFRQPASALEMVKELERIGSPIKAFVSECCVVEPGSSIECIALFNAWCDWARKQGRDHVGTLQVFGRNLAAAYPSIRVARPRVNGNRDRHYEGIRTRSAMDPYPEEA